MAASLKVPPEMAQRIVKAATAKATSARAFMLEAIQEKLDAEETAAGFHREAQARLIEARQTGKAVPAEEVFDYLRARVRGEQVRRPKGRKLP